MDFFCHSLDICIPISESLHKSPMEEHNTLPIKDKGWRKNGKAQAKISLKGEELTMSQMEKHALFFSDKPSSDPSSLVCCSFQTVGGLWPSETESVSYSYSLMNNVYNELIHWMWFHACVEGDGGPQLHAARIS